MRGIISIILASILSDPGRGGQGKCFEIVSNTTAADGRMGCRTILKTQRLATANLSDPHETKLNLRPKVPSQC